MKVIMSLATLAFLAVACSSPGNAEQQRWSEQEIREIIQAEIATIAQGPPGPQGERGLTGATGPAGTISVDCHVHDYELGPGSHVHAVFGSETSEGRTHGFVIGGRKTDEPEPC